MLGAGETITVNEHRAGEKRAKERTYKLRPIKVRELMEIERESLQCYKRDYLQTFKDNLQLFDSKDGDKIMLEELRKVGNWNLGSLPQKDAYAVNFIPVTDELRTWVNKQYGIVPDTDLGIKAVILNALDTGVITSAEVHEFTGTYPMKGQVRYDQWWITGTTEGMISFAYHSVIQCHPEITREHIRDYWSYFKLVEASRKIESITMASVGNG